MSFQEFAQSAQRRSHMGHVKPSVVIGSAVIALVLVGIVAAGWAGLAAAGDVQVVEAQQAASDPETDQQAAETTPKTIFVHVAGCVNSPGVCTLEEGARVSDAIAAVGGLNADAADESINLARIVQDGEQIIVLSQEEAAQSAEVARSEVATSHATGAQADARVNLNTADATQLQTLSGIGASKAAKIIAYREQQGPFKSIDDLLNVSGIGEKTLEALRDSICV